MRRVVITGIGALTPIGNTFSEYAESLKSGISGAGPITKFDASLFKVRFACELKNFDVEKFIHRKDARRLDPFAQYALIVADEAIISSGLEIEKIDQQTFGFRALTTTIWWVSLSAYLIYRGTKVLNYKPEKILGLVLLGISVLKIVFYDLTHVNSNLKIVILIVVGAIML